MKRRILVSVLLVLVILLGAACGGRAPAPGQVADGAFQAIGQGGTVFQFEVTDPDGAVAGWEVHTDEATVGAALFAVGLIAGIDSEWGLLVTEVNGIPADWDADQAFWAFYIDGEFALAGADDTEIEPGVTYAFVYTQG